MHIEFDAYPQNIDEQCDMLEQVCEQIVQSHVAEIEAQPEDTFPCCVKCAKVQFQPVPCMVGVRNAPLTDDQRAALEHTVEHGHPTSKRERAQLEGILDAHSIPPQPLAVRVRNVSELTRRKRGTALDIATFQCAQERRRGKECFVAVDFDEETGNIHAYVKYPDGELKNPQEATIPGGSCGCGGAHEHDDDDDDASAPATPAGSSFKSIVLSNGGGDG